MNLERSGRKQLLHNHGTAPAVACGGCGEKTITSLRIAGVPAEIGNEHTLYINPKRYRYISLVGNRHSALNIQVWHLKSSEFDPHLAINVEKTKQFSQQAYNAI